MKEKALSVLLVTAMTAGMPTGCGGKSEGRDADVGREEDRVISIYGWNDGFRQRIEAIYPEAEKISDDKTVTTLRDGIEIHWIVNPDQDGVYQQKPDRALMKQAGVVEDEEIDISLSEIDHVNKYTDAETDVAIPLRDLGIDPDKDPTDQYDSTKVTVSGAESVQGGSTWQCRPGLLVYRRDIAKEVFDTDSPVIIGEKTNNWDILETAAGELAAKKYFAPASYTDTFRLHGNSIAQPWIANNETIIKADEQIINRIRNSKEWLDVQHFNKTVKGQWNDDWNKTVGSESGVLTFLSPTWGTDFVLNSNWDGEARAWAVTTPLQEYDRGSSYVHAATGTDNTEHVKDIILAVTADEDNLLKISKDRADFTNTKGGMREAAEDDSFASEFLGGQNPFVYYVPVAEKIKIAPLSAYDQDCVELTQNSFNDYFQGRADYDKVKANFETAIKECYPNIIKTE